MKNQNVITFGCRLNSFDSQVIKEKINSKKFKNIFFINTCAVTKEAEKQAKKKIRKLKRENPKSKIIVTGCSAQINPSNYKKMDEVDLILGNEEKFKFEKYLNLLNNNSPNIVVNDIMTHQGTLHKDEIVTLDENLTLSNYRSGEAEYKVRDGVGKIWYVHKNDVKPL